MKFLEYLTEDAIQPYELLKKECGPFLAWAKKNGFKTLLHRYVQNMGNDSVVLKTVRKDRKPKDTPAWAQKILDDAFKKKFGVRPRAEGVFCRPRMIDKYGFDAYGTYYMIPVGEYKCIWSDITDLYVKWMDDVVYPGGESKARTMKNFGAATKAWANKIVSEYTMDNDVTPYSGEVMVLCDKYYMVIDVAMGEVVKKLKNEK